jgi:hypothetical protein
LAINLGVNVTPVATAGGTGSTPATSPLALNPKIFVLPCGKAIYSGPGNGSVLFNGAPTDFTLTKGVKSTTVKTGKSTLNIKAPTYSKGVIVLSGNTLVEISGVGAQPGSLVDVWSSESQRLLGRVIVNADGTFSGWISIPTTLPSDRDTLQVNMVLADSTIQTTTLGVRYSVGPLAGDGKITRNRVATYFAYKSPSLSKNAKVALREFATLFPTNAFSVTTVIGVIRAQGAKDSDRLLALKRARNTKRFLEQQGVQGIISITSATTKDTTAIARRVISVVEGN